MPKILLPVDIAHLHPELIDELDKLVELQGADVHLLYVNQELPSYEHVLKTMGDFPSDLDNQLKVKANAEFDKLQLQLKELGASSVSREIAGGSPAMMIETVARDGNFDLIAMIPGRQDQIQKYLIGSTTGRVIGHTSGTVVIMRGSAKTKPIKNMVIGVDGSDAALYAAKTAVTLLKASERAVQVTLVFVVSVTGIFKFISPVAFVGAIEDNLTMSGEVVLANVEKELADIGVKSNIVLKNGDPADELIKVADELDAELIVLGAQGHSAVEKFVMGSVSTKLATHAKRTLAVIKA